MPRFGDEWVVDRVLIDYVSGGACACCGFQHFLPGNGTADLIYAVTDLESDQVAQEVAALQHHPWPVSLRDQIWADRVRLRQKLKRDIALYKLFWQQHEIDFTAFVLQQDGSLTTTDWDRLLQVPREEIIDLLRDKYNVHAAFAVVMCAVLEQVAHFDLTRYPADGRGVTEISFEQALQYDRRAGFVLRSNLDRLENRQDPKGETTQKELRHMFLRHMQALTGPKLLEKGGGAGGCNTAQSNTSQEEQDDNNSIDDHEGRTPVVESPSYSRPVGPSFQADRRILRLLIARYFAERLQQRFLATTSIPKAGGRGAINVPTTNNIAATPAVAPTIPTGKEKQMDADASALLQSNAEQLGSVKIS